MIVRDFHIEGVTIFKAKTDAPLVIDPDAPLSTAGAFQGLQVIGGRHPEITENIRSIELNQPNPRSNLDSRRKAAGLSGDKKAVCLRAREGPNHVAESKRFVYACQGRIDPGAGNRGAR
jgi:hypothetical protein